VLPGVPQQPALHKFVGHDVLSDAIKLLIEDPPHTAGMQWDVLQLVKDIYCRLGLGIVPRVSAGAARASASEAVATPHPAALLATLPGVTGGDLGQLDHALRSVKTEKKAKVAVKDLLQKAMDCGASRLRPQRKEESKGGNGPLLKTGGDVSTAILNVPEKLLLMSNVNQEGVMAVDPFAGEGSLGLEALFGDNDANDSDLSDDDDL